YFLFLSRWQCIPILLMNGHGSGASDLLVIAQFWWRLAYRAPLAGCTRRTFLCERPQPIRRQCQLAAHQVCRVWGGALHIHQHGLRFLIKPANGTFQINHLWGAPIDALSLVENHLSRSNLSPYTNRSFAQERPFCQTERSVII